VPASPVRRDHVAIAGDDGTVLPRDLREIVARATGSIRAQITSEQQRCLLAIRREHETLRQLIAGDVSGYRPILHEAGDEGKIAGYKIPRHIRFVDAFPLTATGKPQKFRMREAMMAAGMAPDDRADREMFRAERMVRV
jgi:acyl-CoA synthetase (AMP-forming)/AMP-acid ligase II